MPRAKRHYIPGQIWHLTHRCHKREFLLKFDKAFVLETKAKLGAKAIGRRGVKNTEGYELKESQIIGIINEVRQL